MKNAGKPAFIDCTMKIDGEWCLGLTKREYFAGLAMQGLCSNKRFLEGANTLSDRHGELVESIAARKSVAFSDALLKALEDPQLKEDE